MDSSTASSTASGHKGGQPEGTANSAKTLLDTKKLQATSDIAKKMQAVKDSLKRGARLPKGTFSNIQEQVLGSHGLDNVVNMHTIRHRLRKDVLEKIKSGPKSPAAQIQPILLVQAKYRQEAGQPLKPSEGVAFANSMLEGSAIEEKVRGFQKTLRKPPTGKLTSSWWCGFLRYHAKCLQALKGNRLHNARLEDLTYDNIDAMYELVHE
jgi:hypothetical protein